MYTQRPLQYWSPGSSVGSWGSAERIELELQGRWAASASDCACTCAQSRQCVGYVWLGDGRTCWLQSRSTFQASPSPDVSPLTVVGRVQLPEDAFVDCSGGSGGAGIGGGGGSSGGLRVEAGQRPEGTLSSRILGQAQLPASSTQACNAACLMEPFCVAWLLTTDVTGAGGAPVCGLFSSVSSLTADAPNSGRLFGWVQRCTFTPAPPPAPPPAPSPPPPVPAVPSPAAPTGDPPGFQPSSPPAPSPPATVAVQASPPRPPLGSGLVGATEPPGVATPVPSPTSTSSSDSGGGGSGMAIAIGAAVGGAALLLLLAAVAVAVVRRRRRRRQQGASAQRAKHGSLHDEDPSVPLSHPSRAAGSASAVKAGAQHSHAYGAAAGLVDTNTNTNNTGGVAPSHGSQVSLQRRLMGTDHSGAASSVSEEELELHTGLLPGDPFLRFTAPKYRWCTSRSLSYNGVPVEEGLTAGNLAAGVLAGKPWDGPPGLAGPSPVQLSSKEVLDQVELLVHGLVEKGSSAVVFKCRWPGRFGPRALLAAKVLRDPYNYAHTHLLESFKYEAEVLTKCRHPNVVRIYGYCLEPPNVCLIMELLPGSLRERLYGVRLHRKAPAFSLGPHGSLAHTPVTQAPHTPPLHPNVHAALAHSPQAHGPLPPPALQHPQQQQPLGVPALATSAHLNHLTLTGTGGGNTSWSSNSPALDVAFVTPTATPARVSNDQHQHQHQHVHGAGAGSTTEGARAGAGLGAEGGAVSHQPPTHAPTSPPATDEAHHAGAAAGSERESVATVARLAAPNPWVQPPLSAKGLRPEPLSMAEVIAITCNIAAGLQHLHAKVKSDPYAAPPAPASTCGNGAASDPAAPTASDALGSSTAAVTATATATATAVAAAASAMPLQHPLQRQATASSGTGRATGGQLLSRGAAGLTPSSSSVAQAQEDEDQDDDAYVLARVVHRDLKPGNVLINSRGVAKISDFGLAREHQQTTVQTEHTGAGTLRYMAPELLGGHKSLTPKVDIFALGMLMWEMVAGEVPWKHSTDMQVPLLVLSGQRPPVPGPAPAPEELDISKWIHQQLSTSAGGAGAGVGELSDVPRALLLPGGDASDLMGPADFFLCPAFTRLILACWQAEPRARPSATSVHRQVQWLSEQLCLGPDKAGPVTQR